MQGVTNEHQYEPNGELYQSAVNAPGTIEIPESFLNEARQFRELNMRYTCAIREVKTKLEVLNDDLAVRNQRNPIQMIKSRVKKPESIIEKLHRRGFPISVNRYGRTFTMWRGSA